MAPSDPSVHRELGELAATQRAIFDRLEVMERQQAAHLAAIEARQSASDKKLDQVHSWMQQAQGSWKTMVMCGAFGAAVTGVLSNLGGIFSALGVRIGGGGH